MLKTSMRDMRGHVLRRHRGEHNTKTWCRACQVGDNTNTWWTEHELTADHSDNLMKFLRIHKMRDLKVEQPKHKCLWIRNNIDFKEVSKDDMVGGMTSPKSQAPVMVTLPDPAGRMERLENMLMAIRDSIEHVEGRLDRVENKIDKLGDTMERQQGNIHQDIVKLSNTLGPDAPTYIPTPVVAMKKPETVSNNTAEESSSSLSEQRHYNPNDDNEDLQLDYMEDIEHGVDTEPKLNYVPTNAPMRALSDVACSSDSEEDEPDSEEIVTDMPELLSGVSDEEDESDIKDVPLNTMQIDVEKLRQSVASCVREGMTEQETEESAQREGILLRLIRKHQQNDHGWNCSTPTEPKEPVKELSTDVAVAKDPTVVVSESSGAEGKPSQSVTAASPETSIPLHKYTGPKTVKSKRVDSVGRYLRSGKKPKRHPSKTRTDTKKKPVTKPSGTKKRSSARSLSEEEYEDIFTAVLAKKQRVTPPVKKSSVDEVSVKESQTEICVVEDSTKPILEAHVRELSVNVAVTKDVEGALQTLKSIAEETVRGIEAENSGMVVEPSQSAAGVSSEISIEDQATDAAAARVEEIEEVERSTSPEPERKKIRMLIVPDLD